MIALAHARARRCTLAVAGPVLAAGSLLASSTAALGASQQQARHASPAAAGTPALLGSGQTGTRSQVPWAKVGPGWLLAEFTKALPGDSGWAKPGPTTLFLIDPSGGRYVMFRWRAKAPTPFLWAWSGDKTRALMGITLARLEQITLATGKMSTVKLPAAAAAVGYTRPAGSSILAAVPSGNRMSFGSYSLGGKLQTKLADVQGSTEAAIESADGSQLVAATDTGLELTTSTGQVIRSLPVRQSAGGCIASRYWDAGTVLAACGTRNGGERLWLVPLNGDPPGAFTPVRGNRGADLGDIGAWQLGPSTYLQATGACGDEFIARKRAGGSISVIPVPGAPANDNHIVTARGDSLLVQAQTGCTGSNSLLWFNPRTRTERWLLRAGRSQEGVIGVVPYYSTLNANFFL